MNSSTTVLLEKEYRRLKRQTGELEDLLTKSSSEPNWREEVREHLQKLFGGLTRYFELQEEGGFLDEVASQTPHLQEQVKQLYDEQQRLVKDLAKLQDELVICDEARLPEVCRKLDELLARIQDHEARKGKLVMETLNVDEPGTMD